MPQTDAEKAMMATIKAMRKAGTIKYQKILDGEIKVKDKPKELVKFRDNEVIDKMIDISRLEKDLQREQDQDELRYVGRDDINKLNLTGTGIYKPKDPNLIDKLLAGEEPIMVEKQTPDENLIKLHKEKAKTFDIYKPTEKLDPSLHEILEQNKAKELLKALHTDKNGRIAITDIGLREKILHHPSNVEVRTIGSNKVALVAKSSGHDNFRILGNYAPTSGELMTDHFKTLHGDKYTKKGELPMNPYVSKGYENETMEIPETIEEQAEEYNAKRAEERKLKQRIWKKKSREKQN